LFNCKLIFAVPEIIRQAKCVIDTSRKKIVGKPKSPYLKKVKTKSDIFYLVYLVSFLPKTLKTRTTNIRN
jgi:hypothetical protein